MAKKIRAYNSSDTIAAIATFPAAAAISVIRISGNKAFDIADKVFKAKNTKKLKTAKTFTMHYGWIMDGSKKAIETVDEVLVAVMRGPNTYTGEDIVEISSHGGTFVTNKIQDVLLKNGARLANRGEFTYRAFINGKMDLIKAESILNVVNASSDEYLSGAIEQLKGHGSIKLKELREKIKELFVLTEAEISFSDNLIDHKPMQIAGNLKNLKKDFCQLIKELQTGKALREGVRCVFCGKANSGKSTLFNRLLREERVIVSPVPGTTRDIVEEIVMIKDMAVHFYDTAGLIEPKDIITKKAVGKSLELFKTADLVLLVLDGSKKIDARDKQLFEKIVNKKIIAIINKSDLKSKINMDEVKKITKNVVSVSALKDKKIEVLENIIYRVISRNDISRENALFLSAYQSELIVKCEEKIEDALKKAEEGYSLDFINEILLNILRDMEILTGEIFCEDMLTDIFSKFCVGK